MARTSTPNKDQIISAGGIGSLVALLTKEKAHRNAKAEAAGAVYWLCQGRPGTEKAIADAGALKPLVALLADEHDQVSES